MNFSALTDYLNSLDSTYDIPETDCAVRVDHKTVYRHMTGWSDYEKKIPLNGSETYFVYSVSKMFTVTATMQLVERGNISLDDELSRFIPEYENTFVRGENGAKEALVRPVLIKDLLTMTAGMPGHFDGPSTLKMLEEKRAQGIEAGTLDIVRSGAADGLIFQPGSHFQYTACHDTLAAVIEAVSDLKYSDYVKKNICAPLGMTSTGVSSDKALMDRMAAQYWYRNGKSEVHTKTNFAEMTANHENGGASIVSTVDDCITLADALACDGIGATGARILKKETIDLMRTPYLTGQCKEDYDKINKIGYNYGLGVRTLIDKNASRSPIGEFGWDGAAGAYFLSDPENKLSIYLAHHTVALTPGDEIHYKVRDIVYEALGL